MLGEKTLENIKASKSISLCVNEISSLDKLSAILSLYQLLEDAGKTVTVFMPKEPTAKYAEILDANKIKVHTKVDPVKYVIKIDYSKTPIEKVSYDNDEKSGTINFYITPVGKEFDFDNVQYDREGSDFDLNIVIGCKNFEEMNGIFKQRPNLFKRAKSIVINRTFDVEVDNFIKVHKATSFSEVVYGLALDAKFDIKKHVAQQLMVGVIDYSNILEGCESDLPFEIMSQLKTLGANTHKALRKVYFAKSESNYFVQQVLMRNVKVDNANKIVWSAVEYSDIVKAGVGVDELDVKGRIVFNLSESYELYIAAYEFEQQTLKLVIQSNNPEKYSAVKIASVFGGKGNDVCASCTIKNAAASDFEPVVYAVLKDLYNVSSDQPEVVDEENDNNPY